VTPPSLPPSLPPSIHRRDDAKEAMENMHNAELYGRVIRCNYAKPQAIKGGEQGWSMQPVWADADKYQEEIAAGEEEEEEEEGDDDEEDDDDEAEEEGEADDEEEEEEGEEDGEA